MCGGTYGTRFEAQINQERQFNVKLHLKPAPQIGNTVNVQQGSSSSCNPTSSQGMLCNLILHKCKVKCYCCFKVIQC